MGIEDFLPEDKTKPDEFVPEQSVFSFPCSACLHRDRPETECMKCAHYAA